MGIRESLNRRKSLGLAVGIVLLGGSIVAIVMQARAAADPGPGQTYYTVDDGKTFFAESSTKLAPFDKDGKVAFRAHVFPCKGQRVVGYLSRLTPQAQQALIEAKASAGTGKPPRNVGMLSQIGTTGTEVKRPGSRTWVNAGNTDEAIPIRTFRCTDGSTPDEVYP